MDPDIESLVIDCGSGYSKCGFSGESSPRAIFPSIVGRMRNHGIMPMWDRPDCYVGDEAQAKRGILKLKYPIEHGMVTNWNDMEKIWHHTFYNELRVSPEEHSILVCESPFTPKNNREKMTAIMFETFNVFALCAENSSVLSLYAAGRTSGMGVEIGDSVTSVCPVYEGHCFSRASKKLNYGGRDITDYLVKILSERGYELTTSAEREVVRDIKEKLCFSSLNYEEDFQQQHQQQQNLNEKEYELPDGSKLDLGSELFRAPELLFKPSLIGSELGGIHDKIVETLTSKTDLPDDDHLKRMLINNICVSGGSSKFPGLMNRIKKEVDQKLQISGNRHNLKSFSRILCPEYREFSAWLGGSIFSSLSWFVQNKYITKDEYDDCGSTIIHRKCL